MARSRLKSCIPMIRRHNFFIYFALLLILTQLYIGYSFYKLNQEELSALREEVRLRHELHSSSFIGFSNAVLNKSNTLEPSVKPAMIRAFDKQTPKEEDGFSKKLNQLYDRVQSDMKVPADKMENIKKQVNEQVSIETKTGSKNIQKIASLLTDLVERSVDGSKLVAVGNSPNITIPCAAISKDAKSALDRAKTLKCKQDIARIACDQEENYMFADSLPRYCPLQDTNKGQYIGCFKDSHTVRLLGKVKEEFPQDNTVDKCVNLCLTSGLQYAGLEYGRECWCGDSLDVNRREPDEKKCDRPCPGDPQQICGGFLYANVYHTGVGTMPNNEAPYIKELPENTSPVRIVFVLTVNGRADRQVKRLFKAIYHQHHYYYIHVDSRQDHLHREMSELAERFPNVRVAKRRLSTIWGGASLLTMLLRCMEDLLAFTDWQWDFFLNLSESDFPLKPVSELVAYLSVNHDKNFLKSHGTNTPRFIKKQGLDQLFYECETHMWRLGKRHVPKDIVWNGGSDWICLTKEFCRYATSAQDDLMTGLHHYFDYALLPAESFFHTALLNSEYCNTHVNNNLHATNWNRKQGCKCQYKAVVDWCGCSPNDYLPHDINKIKMTRSAPLYFARKFEHIISSSIIAEVEVMAVPQIDIHAPVIGLQAYWQNEFDYRDTRVSDTYFTYYNSLARVSARHATCTALNMTRVNNVHVYAFADKIQGLLVQFEASLGGTAITVEALLQRNDEFKMLTTHTNRLRYIDVGSAWDPKEETFRNYGRLLGPEDSITTALWCTSGGNSVTYSLVFIDPVHVVAASYDVTVKVDQHVLTHSPDFATPLRPGVWTVRVLHNWEPVAETKFHVTPLSHRKRVPITPSQVRDLHPGPPGDEYVERSFRDMHSLLNLGDSSEIRALANKNRMLTGAKLDQWIDELSVRLYNVAELCLGETNNGLVRGNEGKICDLNTCKNTKWSSFSPDPKSHLGEIDPQTQMFVR